MKRWYESNCIYYLYNDTTHEFLELNDGTICGRTEGDLKFGEDALMSRKHCQFSVSNDRIFIEDLKTTNSSKVNGNMIELGRKRRVLINDVIEFGRQRFILTNQNKFAPAHVQDVASAEENRYAGVHKDDGSLTGAMTGLNTQRTLIPVGLKTHLRLKLHRGANRIFDRFKDRKSKSMMRYAGIGAAVIMAFYLTIVTTVYVTRHGDESRNPAASAPR